MASILPNRVSPIAALEMVGWAARGGGGMAAAMLMQN